MLTFAHEPDFWTLLNIYLSFHPGVQLSSCLKPRRKMASNFKLLVKGAKQVVLVCKNGEKFLTKEGMQNLAVIENGSVVIGRDGQIKAVGSADSIESQFRDAVFDKVIDATGMCVLPGKYSVSLSKFSKYHYEPLLN
ncbi:hypothetical protein AOLI_G00110830 [Acnodon oligacanthus]